MPSGAAFVKYVATVAYAETMTPVDRSTFPRMVYAAGNDSSRLFRASVMLCCSGFSMFQHAYGSSGTIRIAVIKAASRISTENLLPMPGSGASVAANTAEALNVVTTIIIVIDDG